MTNKEALKYFTDELARMNNRNNSNEINPISDTKRDAYNTGIEAIKRIIPQKPIYQGPYAPVLCPTCGEWLSKHVRDGYYRCLKPKVCEACYQVLDWGDDDE